VSVGEKSGRIYHWIVYEIEWRYNWIL